MNEILNEPILDYCFITSAFYDFVVNSGKNFQKINLKENEESIVKQFEEMNQENYFDYIESQSYINNNDEQINKFKFKSIQSFFNFEVNFDDKEKIFSEISKKINISMFVNKNLLIKLLSQQIINFLFEVNELFFLIIKDMGKRNKERIEKLGAENLKNIDIRKEKANSKADLSKEKNNESLNIIVNNNDKDLIVKNKYLEKQLYGNTIEKQKETIIKKEELKNINDILIKEKEEEKSKDIENDKSLKILKNVEVFSSSADKYDNYNPTLSDLINQNKDLNLKITNLNSDVSELKKDNESLNSKIFELSEENKKIYLKISELAKGNNILKKDQS